MHKALLGVLMLVAALIGGTRGAMATERIIIDTDFGVPPIDDSFAVALALASPELRVVGITTVVGNQKLPLENAQLADVLERLGRPDVPAYAGAATPLDAPPAYRAFLADPKRLTYFPGQAPAVRAEPSSAVRFRSEPAAAFIAREVLAHPGQVTIVCIGPLTNIARAIASDPRVAHAIRALYVGGGYLRSDPDGGDPTGLPSADAEFNFWVDPLAASSVLRSGARIVLVPYNLNKQTPFSAAQYRTMLGGHSRFSALLRAFAPTMPTWGGRPFPMFDEDVVAALVDPRLSASHRVRLDVVRAHGPHVGESVAGAAHGGAVTVLWRPRADAFRAFVATRLSARASRPAGSTYR